MHRIEQNHEPVVKTRNIENGNRTSVKIKLCPGDGFEQLFHRTEAARQSDVNVCEFMHQGFSHMHVGGDTHVGDSGVHDLGTSQMRRDDSDDCAVSFQHDVGNRTHDTDPASAVDQRVAVRDEELTKLPGGDDELRIVTRS